MRFLLGLVILFGIHANSTSAFGQIRKVLDPIEVREESMYARGVPKDIEGLQWNRWTSKNFVVLALDDSYAKYLNQHLELVKTWTLARWGLIDIEYSVPCKFICVDDPALFEKLFKIKKTKVEVRRDEQGRIKETVIFLLADKQPSHSVPTPVTEISLAEFGQKYNTKFAWWTNRGMSLLNGSLDQIRQRVTNVKTPIENDRPFYFSKSLMELSKDQYEKLSEDQKSLFDSSAVIFCLMIRKEFGQDRFHVLMKDAAIRPEAGLVKATGFESYKDFDRTFKRYMMDLSNEILADKTPDKYLQIYEPERD
jgi:hypothetical protein